MIKQVAFQRFKRFSSTSFLLRPLGITLVTGGNNSGKSTLLQGLAIWEFCKTVLEVERGHQFLLAGGARQGIGLGDDEFSPISVPSLRHLWTNLRTQRATEPDGYTLRISCTWSGPGDNEQVLEFGLALANDRLFIRPTVSTLKDGDAIPRLAYLPPFAGITAKESLAPTAIRRRLIGQGLTGAVLRNLLLDLREQNLKERQRLRGDRAKIKNSDLATLRRADPWERLSAVLRETFSVELSISPFNPVYHSYIRVNVYRGTMQESRFKKLPNYTPRDLMVEGAGFLQWLSVYTLAVDPTVDTLLLDEPDAHLHCSLQEQLMKRLEELADSSGKQVLVATHSTEILRTARPNTVLHIRGSEGQYLQTEEQKVGVLVGLGTEYAPRLNRLQRTKRF